MLEAQGEGEEPGPQVLQGQRDGPGVAAAQAQQQCQQQAQRQPQQQQQQGVGVGPGPAGRWGPERACEPQPAGPTPRGTRGSLFPVGLRADAGRAGVAPRLCPWGHPWGDSIVPMGCGGPPILPGLLLGVSKCGLGLGQHWHCVGGTEGPGEAGEGSELTLGGGCGLPAGDV